MLSKGDLSCLLRVTLRIYRECLGEALIGCLLNWRMVLVHLSYLVVFAGVVHLARLFGPLAGGFIVGFALALLLANYLFTVAAGVRREKLSFSEVYSRGFELFSPTLGVLFTFFILSFLTKLVFASGAMLLVNAVLHLLIAIILNALPEIIYQRPATVLDMFSESFEFIRDDFVEWFIPYVLLGIPILLVNPDTAYSLGLLLITSNPLFLIEYFLLVFADLSTVLTIAPLICAFIFSMYFMFIFRGRLYERLSGSTRRKRIYQERMR